MQTIYLIDYRKPNLELKHRRLGRLQTNSTPPKRTLPLQRTHNHTCSGLLFRSMVCRAIPEGSKRKQVSNEQVIKTRRSRLLYWLHFHIWTSKFLFPPAYSRQNNNTKPNAMQCQPNKKNMGEYLVLLNRMIVTIIGKCGDTVE